MFRPALFSVLLYSFFILPFTGWNLIYAETPPNTLTPEEISEGWILLFDGEGLFGWKTPNQDSWKVENGSICSATPGIARIATTTEFSDFILHFTYRTSSDGALVMRFREPMAGDNLEKNTILPSTKGVDGDIECRVKNRKVYATLNGRKIPSVKSEGAAHGSILFEAAGQKGEIELRNIKLLPLNTKPIFNGKNLDGWSILPDHKSEFTVTPAGELNIKNGNGQIETIGQWADFVLQMDIRTNGDHLNSGVFFRGNPGAFWSGYESQIRNQWEGEDRTKPVDFGTGGIYGRQPARKVVSSDQEWFTKTIVACGNHIAVWVNGYQVSDFTDTRVKGRNAREQSRLQAGTISLQGHDPTTDLSFRNIRLAEYE